MPAIINADLGKIIITDDIITTIAGYATIENYGVVGMASQKASDGIAELLKRENVKKGVVVSTTNNVITVDVYIIVEYGVSINAVAQNIIENVSYRVRETTGLAVGCVNVHVEGVRVQPS